MSAAAAWASTHADRLLLALLHLLPRQDGFTVTTKGGKKFDDVDLTGVRRQGWRAWCCAHAVHAAALQSWANAARPPCDALAAALTACRAGVG